ncbi:MAG: penicillin-binding protein 1C [Steroidobacteraceae bacterium]
MRLPRIGHCTQIAITAMVAAAIIAVLMAPARGVADFDAVRAGYVPSDSWLLDRHGRLLDRERLDFGVRRLEWTSLESISPALVDAVIAGEDRRFKGHGGVDWRGVASALVDTLRDARPRGASTITMQLAAMIDPRAARDDAKPDWRRKLAQIRIALAIERRWSKPQILEAYLNLLGFRGELQGIGAAAEVLVGKTPSGLEVTESLVLAALLPAPAADSATVARRACRRAELAQIAVQCSAIRATADSILSRSRTPLPAPALAPHVARALLTVPGAHVGSTLDFRTQQLAADTLGRHIAMLGDRNVRDGAVLVVDNATGDVLAYVGSGGPASRAANIDGIRARRQAGSTLKPFLYGLALERRYLTAASLLDDSPVNLDTASGIYLPQNYDQVYRGPVSVRTALGSSLNIPAVRTLVLIGVEPFRDRLWKLGYGGIVQDGEYYGYSLALGSAEVSLWEQAQAYRALARGGLFSPLRLLAGDDVPDEPILPAEAAFIVSDILADRAARMTTFGLTSYLDTPFWSAVKTGTSKDMRDNWCIGFSTAYTVAVWVGNFEGDSMHDVSGVTGAAPVWQEIMLALHEGSPAPPPTAPMQLVSNLARFNPAVEAPRQEWFIDGTVTSEIGAVMPGSGIARITSPPNGMVIALDPDIPSAHQRVPIEAAGGSKSMQLRLDEKAIGSATDLHLWQPSAGAHRLALVDDRGRVVDQVLFTVR